jgi:hypothetical protein
MNIRAVIILVIIIIFAVGFGVMSFTSFQATSLTQAYQSGKANVTQITEAGTIPHQVSINNTDNKPIAVKKGDVLTSSSSQDLVIAENKQIPPNSNGTVKAYCYEPQQKASPGEKLVPGNQSSTAVKQIIEQSNIADSKNATQSQLQIWALVSGGNVNVYTGEAPAVVEKGNMYYYQLSQNLTNAKNDVMTKFNLTAEQIQNINLTSIQTNTGNISNWTGSLMDWLNGFIEWIKNTVGIQ